MKFLILLLMIVGMPSAFFTSRQDLSHKQLWMRILLRIDCYGTLIVSSIILLKYFKII